MKMLIVFAADECKKLLLQAKIKIIIALSALSAVAVGLAGILVGNNTGIQMVAPGRFPVFVLELMTGFVMPVLAIFIGSELAGEFKDGSIKNLFALPVPKSIIYSGKIAASAAIIGICLLGMGISGTAVSGIINGAEAFGSFGGVVISYLGAFAFLVMVVIITSFFTLLTGSPGMAIIMNLFVWFGIGTASIFLTDIKSYLPMSFAHWYQPLVNGADPARALPPVLYMISYGIVFIAAGIMLFDRKEV